MKIRKDKLVEIILFYLVRLLAGFFAFILISLSFYLVILTYVHISLSYVLNIVGRYYLAGALILAAAKVIFWAVKEYHDREETNS